MGKVTRRGGSVNSTSGWTANSGVEVYVTGVSFVTGNLDREGERRVYVEDIDPVYTDGGSGVSGRITKDNATSSGGRWFTSGGTCRLGIFKSGGGTMFFGRNTGGSPSPVRNTADGTTWSGTLVMDIEWSTVPSRPVSIAVSRDGRDVTVSRGASTDNGGQSITNYGYQYSTNGGVTWSAEAVDGASHTFENLPPGLTYVFRVYAINVRGRSESRQSSSVFIPAGFTRWDGSQEVPTSTLVRWDGSQEVPITTLVRWDGTQEVPVS